MTLSRFVAIAFLAFSIGHLSAPAQAGVTVFNFSGLCDDCAGEGSLFPLNPVNLGDEIFEPVSGVLTLMDYSLGGILMPSNLISFEYSGSSLTESFTIHGGEGGGTIFGFIDSGEEGGLIADLGIVDAFYSFNLSFFGTWDIGPGECGFACGDSDGDDIPDFLPFDVGVAGALTTVPSPGALVLMGVGLLGLGARRWFA